ncbi:MAG: response regulator [Betaproteobacteria bacterium]|nr:response regulator [Betaproteobacteria bacterium]
MSDFTGQRALVIDDSATARQALRTVLADLGFTAIDVASGAADALFRIKNTRYALVVCDYMLAPGTMNGQELLETIRHAGLLPSSTVFIMVTGERSYERVVAAAELAPDDYLIKPFSAALIMERLYRIREKKSAFAEIHRELDAGNLDGALGACDLLLAKASPYHLDALRLKAELLIAAGRAEEAQPLYEEVLTSRAVPWAKMGLAKALRARQELDAAREILAELVGESQHYIEAIDLLAEVEAASGAMDRAVEVLHEAAKRSPNRVVRFRKLGQLAADAGQSALAKEALQTVVDRGGAIKELGDYLSLAKVQADSGGAKEAISTLKGARKLFADPYADYRATLVESFAHSKAGNPDEAVAALARAESLVSEHELAPGMDARLDLAHAHLAAGQEEVGMAILHRHQGSETFIAKAQKILTSMGRAELGEEIARKSDAEVIQINNDAVVLAQKGDLKGAADALMKAAEQLPENLRIVANAAQACLALLQRTGMEPLYWQAAQTYLEEIEKRDGAHPKLAMLKNMAQGIRTKFGLHKGR